MKSRERAFLHHRRLAITYAAVLNTLLPVSASADEPSRGTFRLVREVQNKDAVHRIAFAQNGAHLVCFCGSPQFPDFGNVYVWDVATGKLLREYRPTLPYWFARHPGARLVRWTDSGIAINDDFIDLHEKNVQLAEHKPRHLMTKLEFSSDGRFVAGVDRTDKEVKVWDTTLNRLIASIALPSTHLGMHAVRQIAFDTTTDRIAIGTNGGVNAAGEDCGGVIVWDIDKAQEVLRADESHRVFDVAFSDSGNLITGGAAGQNSDVGIIRIRRRSDLDAIQEIRVPSGVMALAPVGENCIVTAGWDGSTMAWDRATGIFLCKAPEQSQMLMTVATTKNGRRRVAAGSWTGSAFVWEFEDNTAGKP